MNDPPGEPTPKLNARQLRQRKAEEEANKNALTPQQIKLRELEVILILLLWFTATVSYKGALLIVIS